MVPFEASTNINRIDNYFNSGSFSGNHIISWFGDKEFQSLKNEYDPMSGFFRLLYNMLDSCYSSSSVPGPGDNQIASQTSGRPPPVCFTLRSTKLSLAANRTTGFSVCRWPDLHAPVSIANDEIWFCSYQCAVFNTLGRFWAASRFFSM